MICNLVSIYFNSPQLGIQLKKAVWNSRILIQRYAQFWFFKKGSGNSFSATFRVWFFEENVSHVIFYSWPNFIAWLPLLHEILGNMCIAIVCFQGCDVTNFETNLIFLIKPFLNMTKKSRQKPRYLEEGKSF